jgi:hypothetical protein
MPDLSDFEIASLNWMRHINDDYRSGLYGPTIRRRGGVPECERLVSLGYARRNEHGARGENTRGYWIMPAGRAELVKHLRPTP